MCRWFKVQCSITLCRFSPVEFCSLYRLALVFVVYHGLIVVFGRDEDLDPVIFDLPDSDPVLFSTDPDPSCNNGFIKLFSP